MWKKFYDLLYEPINNKQNTNLYLPSERQNFLTNEVKEASCVKEKQTVEAL